MAVNVIDALVVELGLDPKNFTANQKKTLDDFNKFVDVSVKGGKKIEETSKGMADGFAAVTRRALALYGLLVGAGSLKEFVVDQTNVNAALGRTAKATDQAIGVLSAWRNLAIINGGTAEGVTRSIQGLVQEFQNFALTGESSVLPYFRALRVNIADLKTGKMRDISDILLDLAAAGEKLDKAKAAALFRGIGLDEDTINLLLLGHDALKKQLDLQKQLGTVSDKDATAAIALQAAWGRAEVASTSFGRSLLTTLAPSLVKILDLMAGLFANNQRGQLFWKGLGRLADSPFVEGGFEGGLNDLFSSLFGGAELDQPAGAPAPGNPTTPGIPTAGQRLLGAISGPESGGAYNVEYGGSRFSNYADHPNVPHVITSGPNKGSYSTAAGRYQMLYGTWKAAQRALGLKDFSPASQDRAAWWLAQRDYKARTGRDLSAALAANDPNIGRVLSKTWTSLPGGIEQAGPHGPSKAYLNGISPRFADALSTVKPSQNVHIGQVVVNTNEKHAPGIARDIKGALHRSMAAPHANNGQN